MERQGFGERLLKARHDAGLTVEQASEKTGVSVQSIHFYECERRVPRDEVKVKLANLYGVPLVALFYGA